MCGMQKGAEMKKILSLVLTLCLLTALTGCSIGSAGSDKLQVVCTIFPQYDFVRAVAGDLVENTLLLLSALHKAGVPCEAHLFEKGCHGTSISTPEVDADSAHRHCWVQLAVEWLNDTFSFHA